MKHLLFIIILFFLLGCKRFKDDKPAGLIPREQMTEILADIHVADAVVEQKYGQPNPNLPLTVALYDRIYQNRHISAAQYKLSYAYYESHPQQMDNMYLQVITELSKREAVMNKK